MDQEHDPGTEQRPARTPCTAPAGGSCAGIGFTAGPALKMRQHQRHGVSAAGYSRGTTPLTDTFPAFVIHSFPPAANQGFTKQQSTWETPLFRAKIV